MTSVPEGISAHKRILSRKAAGDNLKASASKRGWCCFCPGEGPPKESKHSKMMQHKPATAAAVAPPLDSGEAGSAPRIDPVPAYGPVMEARAFPKTEDALDFRHWR